MLLYKKLLLMTFSTTYVINLQSPCICNMLNDHCHRVSTHFQSINIIILLSPTVWTSCVTC